MTTVTGALICPKFIAAGDAGLCRMEALYCERPSAVADLWGEPFNAVSNVAFFIAALLVWRMLRRMPQKARTSYWPFPLLLALVGLGSLAFHTLATKWAEWVDVLPILLSVLVYFWFALRGFLGWSAPLTAAGVAALLAATIGFETGIPDAVLWGGAMYLPILAGLTGIAAALAVRKKPAAKPMLAAIGLFLASFMARSLDHSLCSTIPAGTHFLWHLLNAALLYLLVRTLVVYTPQLR